MLTFAVVAALASVGAATGAAVVGSLAGRTFPVLGGSLAWTTSPAVEAAAALALLLLTANAIYERCPGPTFIPASVPLLAVLDAVVVAGTVPAGPGSGAAGAFRWLLIGLLGAGTAKFFALHRYAYGQSTTDTCRDLALLPARDSDLGDLELLLECNRDRSQVVPVVGRWGEGKSFVLDVFRRQCWGRRGRPAMIVLDIWKLESDRELQVKIIEALFAHPNYRRRWRWLAIPLSFSIAEPLGLGRVVRSLKLKLGQVGVEADLTIPQLSWQRLYERITAGAPQPGTVIALDELDRATPAVTQAALTLIKRSTQSPKVVVVLAYTPEIIRYKAFNPLLDTLLPDLATSMQAVLYDAVQARSDGRLATLLGVPVATDARGKEKPEGVVACDLTKGLTNVFAACPRETRERLQARFEEKYLGPAKLTLHPPGSRDVAEMVRVFPDLRQHMLRLLARRPPPVRGQIPNGDNDDDPELGKAAEQVRSGLDALRGQRPPIHLGRDYPPLRVLHGGISTVLQAAAELARGSGGTAARPLSPRTLAALVLVGVDLTDLRYSTRDDEP